ncbi:hypothetical protein [Cohnella hashimotonis]|uniref:DUF4179 domain-containing protein n=1 Tax=Cohnella hashimotonis TaxID=2826895 RepID=A0ABT6TTT7_9BACL|nr:hypothetical protein [Cohnella hashimotonis]MDI4649197.1 hypothetical protein [Cohnella hashimotonis]
MPTDDMKRLMETIPLPDELRERSRAGIAAAARERQRPEGRRRKRALATAAALLALLVLSAGIANHDRVWAALRKTFQFSPGTGIVSEEETPSERYVLKKPIVLNVGQGKITITGILSDKEMTYITMAGEQAPRVESLELVNEQGDVFKIPRSMSTWAAGEWTASFWSEGKLDLKGAIKLRLPLQPVREVEARLDQADAAASYPELGKTASVNGLSVTAIADRVGDRARIALVSPPQTSFRIDSYGIITAARYGSNNPLTVKDETGTPLELSFVRGTGAPQSEFYFPLSDRLGAAYTMSIPEISVAYPDEVTVKLPAVTTNGLNKTFEIAGYPVTITKTERMKPGSLRIYTDLHAEGQPDRMLYNLDVDRSSMAKLDERTGAVAYMEFEVEPDAKSVIVTFRRPTAVLRGPWAFTWTADEIQP